MCQKMEGRGAGRGGGGVGLTPSPLLLRWLSTHGTEDYDFAIVTPNTVLAPTSVSTTKIRAPSSECTAPTTHPLFRSVRHYSLV